MKVAKWEVSAGALITFLNSKPQSALVADLYTFNLVGTRNGGTALLYTTADIDVTIPTFGTYSSKDVYFDQLNNKAYGHWKVGLDVDTWQVETTPSENATIGGQPWITGANAGIFDGATMLVDRVFFDNRPSGLPALPSNPLGSPIGTVNIFTGRVAEIDYGRTNVVINANDFRDQLSQNMPRNLFQATCRWTLFGAGCELVASSYAVTGTCAADTSTNVITSSVSAPSGSGTYALGRVVCTSGANNGFSRMIRSWTAGSPASFTLICPFPYLLSASDGLTFYPGCNKSLGACNAFGNSQHFGGQPSIPQPEAAT